MNKTFEQAIEDAKEIIADELKFQLQQEATKAIGGRQTKDINRTGHLIGNIDVRVNNDVLEISMPFYGKYLEYGTGLYGPKEKVIKPKEKQVLCFEINGKEIFATHTKGMTPSPFIRPTFHKQLKKIAEKAVRIAFSDNAATVEVEL
jgi:HK97 gp10 family phage protein